MDPWLTVGGSLAPVQVVSDTDRRLTGTSSISDRGGIDYRGQYAGLGVHRLFHILR